VHHDLSLSRLARLMDASMIAGAALIPFMDTTAH
jgi:hypothetical protein